MLCLLFLINFESSRAKREQWWIFELSHGFKYGNNLKCRTKRRGIIGCLLVTQTSPLGITIAKHPNQQNRFKLESRDSARLAKVLLLTRWRWERGKIYRQPDPPTFPRRALIVGTCLLSDCLRLASRAIVKMLQQRATDRNNYPFLWDCWFDLELYLIPSPTKGWMPTRPWLVPRVPT